MCVFMSISNLQMFGIVMGCIPGINFVAGTIKFFIYMHQEFDLKKTITNRTRVEQTAKKLENIDQSMFKEDKKNMTNLKWYALLQVLPLVGAYGAYKEKKLLEKINTPIKTQLDTSHLVQVEVIQAQDPEHIMMKMTDTLLLMDDTGSFVNKKQNEICKEISKKEFDKFLLSSPEITQANKTLLLNTLCKVEYLPTNMNHYNVHASADQLEQVRKLSLTTSFLNKKSEVRLEKGWFQYHEAHHFYIDFAHATHLGGAYRSYGCVQEERMFTEFTALSLLDFITQNGVHPCIDKDKIHHETYPPEALPFPFIVEEIKRDFDISHVPYGQAFKKASEKTILDGIVPVKDPVPVSIMGLAAVDWRGVENPQYTLKDLVYHFDAAFLANKGAQALVKEKFPDLATATVHTAPWGCGEFRNSVKVLMAIQYLAARVAGVEIVFHGVGNPMNPEYTQENIQKIVEEMEEYLSQKQTPQQVIETLLEKQKSDPSWAPRK